MSETERRVEAHGIFEHPHREFEIDPRQATNVVPTAQKEVISLKILRRAEGQRFPLLRGKRDPHRLSDAAGDLGLHVEDVLQLAVVTLGPERVVGLCVDQLGVDPEPVAEPADTAREDARGPQLLPYLRWSHWPVAEGKHAGP